MRYLLPVLVMVLMIGPGLARGQADLDIEEVIAGAVVRDSIRRAEVRDMVLSAESYARTLGGDGSVKEEKKFIKTYYFKDSLFKEEFLEYYLDGERQDDRALQEQVREAEERRRKGRNRDASVNPMDPFYPENRQYYKFSMPGVEKQRGCICYHVVAECLIEDENLLQGDYWFEVNWLNLAYAEFRPARMPSKIKRLDMNMSFAPIEEGYWLPMGFHLLGKGKVLVFIKFNFEVEERYSYHRLNVGLTDDFFREVADEK